MQPPPTQWGQQAGQLSPPMQQASPQEQVFAPPVIGRDGSKPRKTQAYKAPKPVQAKQKDERSLKSYVYLGLAITVLLGGIMTVWLWLLSPNRDADDLDQANTSGDAAQAVTIETWNDGAVDLTWTAAEDAEGLRYIVFAQRVGDEKAEPLNPEGTTATEFSAAG